jgi:hypothetical protein
LTRQTIFKVTQIKYEKSYEKELENIFNTLRLNNLQKATMEKNFFDLKKAYEPVCKKEFDKKFKLIKA